MSKTISIILFIFCIFCIVTLPVNSKVFFLEAEYYQDKTQERTLVLGKGEIITSDKAIIKAAISDPSIIGLQVLGEKQLFIRAKQLGISTLLVWEKEKSTPSRFDISVWPDIEYLTKELHELDENIVIDYIPPTSNAGSGGAQGTSSQQSSESSSQEGGSSTQSSGAFGAFGDAGGSSSSSSNNSQLTSGRIILKGEVKNAEVIAKALQIAGVYVGDEGIKIISQPGGQIVDGGNGESEDSGDSSSEDSDSGEGSGAPFGSKSSMKFTSNKTTNLTRGVIATTQKGAVLSFLKVKDPPQISVAIRFYEISRTLARNIGVNTLIGGSTLQGGSFVGGETLTKPEGVVSTFGNVSEFKAGESPEFKLGHLAVSGSALFQTLGQGVTGVIFNPDNGIGAVIQALQERGEVKLLAEPTLVIANGEPGLFLAGGEVPITRAILTGSGAGQDVSYEPFGIKFSFLPLVTSENRIFLHLIPEIREIDQELSKFVAPGGSTAARPPAFKTKRTETQVELESGQAFAISGLLKQENFKSLRKVPGIGDIPVLGALFRSKSFRKGESELLIVVSPQIVKPIDSDKIAKKSTIPDVPDTEFNQLPEFKFKPEIKKDKDDEKGPEMKTPLDAGKYNNPVSQEEEKVDNSLRDFSTRKISEGCRGVMYNVTAEPTASKNVSGGFSINEKLERRKEQAAKAQACLEHTKKQAKNVPKRNILSAKEGKQKSKPGFLQIQRKSENLQRAYELSAEMQNLYNQYEHSRKKRLEKFQKNLIN